MMAVNGLERRITELKKVADKLAAEAKGLDDNGQLRIRKLKWLFEKEQIRQQRDDLHSAKSSLVEAFQVLQSSQL